MLKAFFIGKISALVEPTGRVHTQYAELLDQRHPEKREEQLKETLFQSYLKSERTLEEILAFMEGYDVDEF